MTGKYVRVVALLLLCVTHPSWATISIGFDGVVATLNTGSVASSGPADVTADPAGNIYIADKLNNRIVRTSPDGTSAVLNITGLSPALSAPVGLAVDGSSNLYIADSGNSRIVEVSASGAGSVLATPSITLSSPNGVAVDRSGNIYIADTGANRIVEMSSAGAASVFFSSATSISSATLSSPTGITVDPSGNLYVADSGNNRLVKITAAAAGSVVSTAALGTPLSNPTDVAVDFIGNIYIADKGNNRVVEIPLGQSAAPYTTGTVTFTSPTGVGVDTSGTVYITDTAGNQIVSVAKSAVGFGHVALGASSGTVLTLPFTVGSSTLGAIKVLTSGSGSLDFTLGGGSTCAAGTTGTACTVDVQFLPTAPGVRRGTVVIYDNGSPQIPLITVPLYAVADAPVAAVAPNTATLISVGSGVLNLPFQVALDGAGNMYVGNYNAQNVLKVSAGGGSASIVNTGSITLAYVTGVAVDAAGNLFIADHIHSRIVVVTADGIPSVLTINGISPGLNLPTGLAIDKNGTLYITDWQNNRVVEVTSLSLATSTSGSSSGNGSVLSTGTYLIGTTSDTGVAVDAAGTVYVADRTNNRVIKVTAGGAASLVAVPGISALRNSQGVAVDGMGNLYIDDAGNNRIVQVTTAGVASVVATPGLPAPTTLGAPYGITADSSGNLIIPDWTNNRLIKVDFGAGVLAFPNTAAGANSANKTATVTNLGNQALTFPVPGSGNNPTVAANFALDSSSTCPVANGSAGAGTLLPGAQCTLVAKFAPTSVGALTGSIVLTDNTRNAPGPTYATQAIAMSGTGTAPVQVTPVITWPTPGSIAYGTALSSTQLDASTTAAGTFAYTPAAGTVLSVGTHTLSATFTPTNAAAYTSATGSTSITVSQLATTVAVSSAGSSGGTTLTATVTSSYGVPTGTVQFSNGTTSLGVGTLDSSGVGTITASSLPAGSTDITATYSGDANYAGSTGTVSVQTVTPGFTISANPAALNVTLGSTGIVALTFTPTGGFTGDVAFSCSGLPASEACNFGPTTLHADGTDTVQTTNMIISQPQSASGLGAAGPGDPRSAGLFLLPGVFLGGLWGFQRRRPRGSKKGWLVLGVLSVCAAVAGCGTNHPHYTVVDVTVTATATGTASGYQGPATQSVALTVTVIS